MKCVVLSHACVVPRYQEKLAILAEDPNMKVVFVAPPYSREGARIVHLEGSPPDGCRVIRARTIFTGNMFVTMYRGLERLLRAEKPDVVYVEEEPCSLAAAQVARLCRKLGTFTFIFFSWENIAQRWYRFPNPRVFVYPRCERLVFSQAHAGVAGGVEAMKAARERGYHGPITVIPQFGVDVNVFAKCNTAALRRRLQLTHPVVGYVGRLLPEKGVSTLVEAFARLQPDHNLLIIGSGPERKRIEQQVQALGLADRTRLIAAVPHDEVPHYMNCIDTLVLPSLTTQAWKEQFGRVLIEAMACEVPVVGSSSGEIPAVIGPAGRIFAEGDAADLAEKLAATLAGDRAQAGAIGRKRVLEHYTMRAIAERLRRYICDVHEAFNTPAPGRRAGAANAYPGR